MRTTRLSALAAAAVAAAMLAACSSVPRGTSSAMSTVQATAVDLTKPPTLAAPPDLRLPPIVTRELPNGLKLMIVEHRELPVADFVLVSRAGLETDTPDHLGLASLTAAMLDEGTATRNALQIADQIAFLGIRLGTGGTWDYSTVTLHTPTAQLDSALALFADVALRPAFPQQDLDRLRNERLTSLTQLKDRPTVIADQAYNAILYGNAHPYGRPTIGTEASLKRITQSDLRRFYDSYWRPNNTTLIVVGDVRADDIERKLRAHFGGWERRDVPRTTYPPAPAAGNTAVYLVDKPGAAQTSVRIGGVGVARNSQDYFPLQVMNTILGGSFTSRLNSNLRETRGFTYGAGSGFSMRTQAGPFTARAEIVAAKTDSALVEFMKELRAIRDTVPAQELEKAKRYLQLGLPDAFETSGDIAGQLVPIAVYDLPLDYYDGYVRRIGAVTQADVQRVARRYVDPSRLAVIVVGDRKTIEAGIKAVNLGQVSIRDMMGAPIP